MGDYLNSTLKKCILGITHAVVTGKPISPSTEENCAVAKRELEKAKPSYVPPKQANPAKIPTRHLLRLIHHPNPESLRRFIEEHKSVLQRTPHPKN